MNPTGTRGDASLGGTIVVGVPPKPKFVILSAIILITAAILFVSELSDFQKQVKNSGR